LWANLHVWRDLCRDAWMAPRWFDKLRIWFMPQGWRPEGLLPYPPAPEVTRESVVQYDAEVPRGLNAYVLVHFVGTLALAIGLLAMAKSFSRAELVLPAALVLWALLNFGGILDHRRWALPSELLRLPVMAGMVAGWLRDGPWLAPAQASLAMAVVVSWLCLLIYRGQFDGAQQRPAVASR
jgi:alkylglycerol monooxygenase